MPAESIDCVVTSPPYLGLRDYGCEGQIGNESTVEEYIDRLAAVFDEVYRVLKSKGTLWLNIGDTYSGSGKGGAVYPENAKKYKQGTNKGAISNVIKTKGYPGFRSKELIGIPWLLVFALRKRGWMLRQDIIWSKPNPMPESVSDRFTKSHEYIFLFTKQGNYSFETLVEPSIEWETRRRGSDCGHSHAQIKHISESFRYPRPFRNKRDVWEIPVAYSNCGHFATFPEELASNCIKAGCPEGGTVLDPFAGSGTTGLVAKKLDRLFIGFEINPEYVKMSKDRIQTELGLFNK